MDRGAAPVFYCAAGIHSVLFRNFRNCAYFPAQNALVSEFQKYLALHPASAYSF